MSQKWNHWVLSAMNTGHDGSLTTLHAGSAQEAVSRLVLMSRFGMDLPADLIEEQVATAVDLIVMSKRLAKGQRRVTSTSLVERSEGGGVRLTEIVSFDEANNRWQLVQEPPFIGQALATGQLGDEEVARWRSGFGA